MRLLAKGGFAGFTTNAVAETAGVSIGTLYQYFANKEAILDALADREMARLSERVLVVFNDPADIPLEDRIRRIIGAVASSYGGQRQVHRLLLEYSLRHGGGRLAPLVEKLIVLLTEEGGPAGAQHIGPLPHAEAFVLTHAFAGVIRSMILSQEATLASPADIEDALTRLIVGFPRRSDD